MDHPILLWSQLTSIYFHCRIAVKVKDSKIGQLSVSKILLINFFFHLLPLPILLPYYDQLLYIYHYHIIIIATSIGFGT